MSHNHQLSKKHSIDNILIVLFLILFCVLHIFQNIPSILVNGIIAFTGILCYLVVLLKYKFDNKWIVISFFAAFLMAISIIVNGNASFFEIIWIFSFIGLALLFENSNISSRTLLIIFLFVVGVFAIQAILGIDPQDALNIGSGNNISTFVIFYALLLYIKRYDEGKGIIYWPAILSLVISLWGNGRGGVLSCLVFIVALFLYDCLYNKKYKLSKIIRFAIALMIFIFIVNRFFSQYITIFIQKLDRYGSNSIRTTIWKEYIDGALNNFDNLFLGVNTRDERYRWLSFYAGNTHNAFLMAHAKFGLVGFGYIVCNILKSIIIFLKKNSSFLVVIFIAWFLRSMLDWTGFPGIFDVMFWIFLIRSEKLRKGGN